MQVSANWANLGRQPDMPDLHSVETPVKRSKVGFHSNLKTAETPNMPVSESKPTLADVDAEELFSNFSRMVTISETEQHLEQPELLRRLQYE